MSWYMIYCGDFFFKQKTAYEMRISDWSSDVCSSDLALVGAVTRLFRRPHGNEDRAGNDDDKLDQGDAAEQPQHRHDLAARRMIGEDHPEIEGVGGAHAGKHQPGGLFAKSHRKIHVRFDNQHVKYI